ncbi:MAG: hypothetical protein HC933_00505 [Pleurocapsa sp. SU_196_0]|nr:hypothetical protein [Pleurocapsa sp. SU_196_0]
MTLLETVLSFSDRLAPQMLEMRRVALRDMSRKALQLEAKTFCQGRPGTAFQASLDRQERAS